MLNILEKDHCWTSVRISLTSLGRFVCKKVFFSEILKRLKSNIEKNADSLETRRPQDEKNIYILKTEFPMALFCRPETPENFESKNQKVFKASYSKGSTFWQLFFLTGVHHLSVLLLNPNIPKDQRTLELRITSVQSEDKIMWIL